MSEKYPRKRVGHVHHLREAAACARHALTVTRMAAMAERRVIITVSPSPGGCGEAGVPCDQRSWDGHIKRIMEV
jgi:hypothetical protein